MKKTRKQVQQTNKNAVIVSRIDRTGKARTETQRRDDDSVQFAVSTNRRDNSTNLFIDFPFELDSYGNSVQLTGREARSLYRLLRKHYKFTSKSRSV